MLRPHAGYDIKALAERVEVREVGIRCTAAAEPIVTYLASSLRRLASLINRSSRGLERIRKRTVGWVKFAYSARGTIKASMASVAHSRRYLKGQHVRANGL